MDADVRFKGRRIEHGGSLPDTSDLLTHIILKTPTYAPQPLKFGLAGGVLFQHPSGRG